MTTLQTQIKELRANLKTAVEDIKTSGTTPEQLKEDTDQITFFIREFVSGLIQEEPLVLGLTNRSLEQLANNRLLKRIRDSL